MTAQAKPKKSKRDLNQLAQAIVAEATEESSEPIQADEEEPESEDEGAEKNPAAVALGRLGGKKGGPARAAKLSARKRKEIAKNAAKARWGKEEK